jgi:Post-segregation antitoxin CcdA
MTTTWRMPIYQCRESDHMRRNKRTLTIKLDERLLEDARTLGVDLSRAAEDGILAEIDAARTAQKPSHGLFRYKVDAEAARAAKVEAMHESDPAISDTSQE